SSPMGVPYGPPGSEAPKPKSISDMADDAFRKGRDREALQLVCAAALVDDTTAERLPDDFRWVPSLKKPALSVRWGIGVIYNPAKGYTGPPSPVGYTAPAASNGNSSPMGGGAPGYSPTGGSPGTGGDKPRKSHILG